MADPITAFSTASAAFQVAQIAMQTGRYLWKLGKAISKVEQTVRNLAAEVDAVSQACNLIDQEIKGVLPNRGAELGEKYDEDDTLWRTVTLQLIATKATVHDLQVIVGEDGNESKDIFKKASKQLHLNRNRDELEAIKHRIQVHTQSLQMALQMVNIKIAYIAPKLASDDLGEKIEDLKAGVQKLQLSYQADGQKGNTPSEVELIQCAKEIMRSGKTLCEESLAGDYRQGGENAARINKVVAEWAGDVESLRRDTERSVLSDATHLLQAPSVFSEEIPSSPFTGRTTAVDETDQELFSKDMEETDEVDDDWELEVAQAALEQGQEAFDQEDWREAETLLKESLSEFKKLPPKRRAGCDIFELEYRLTVCAYHTREAGIAKEALMSLVGHTPTSDEQKVRIYDAAHLLAQLHLREGELEAARMTCESTLKARSRLLGKTHDSYFESLALMAHVYFLQGNAPRARVLMGMVPASRRTALREALQVLPTPTPPMLMDDSSAGGIVGNMSTPSLARSPSAAESLESMPLSPAERRESETPSFYVQSQDGRRTWRHNSDMLEKRDSFQTTTCSVPESRSDGRQGTDGVGRGESSITIAATPEQGHAAVPRVDDLVDRAARKRLLPYVAREPRDKLERAICEGEIGIALSMITNTRFVPTAGDAFALHYSAYFGDLDIATALLDREWDVNALVRTTRSVKFAPLDLAMAARRPAMVQLLFRHGAELISRRPNGYGGVVINCVPFSIWLEKPWCTAFPSTGSSVMISCIAHTMRSGWLVDEPIGYYDGDAFHTCTLLRRVVLSYQLSNEVRYAMVEFLLEQGASPLDSLQGGRTILHTAIMRDRSEVLPVLLKKDTQLQLNQRCDVRHFEKRPTDPDGEEDALCLAVRLTAKKSINVSNVKALLDAGANAHSSNKVRAADLPSSLQPKSRFKAILKSDALVTVTPMQIAMASGNDGLIRLMATHDA